MSASCVCAGCGEKQKEERIYAFCACLRANIAFDHLDNKCSVLCVDCCAAVTRSVGATCVGCASWFCTSHQREVWDGLCRGCQQVERDCAVCDSKWDVRDMRECAQCLRLICAHEDMKMEDDRCTWCIDETHLEVCDSCGKVRPAENLTTPTSHFVPGQINPMMTVCKPELYPSCPGHKSLRAMPS